MCVVLLEVVVAAFERQTTKSGKSSCRREAKTGRQKNKNKTEVSGVFHFLNKILFIHFYNLEEKKSTFFRHNIITCRTRIEMCV